MSNYRIKTLACDAQGLLKLSFHGNKTTYSDFGYIGCLVTFFTIIRKVIKEKQINKVILFWDGENSGKLRHDIYPQYKSNRDKSWNNSIILTEKNILKEENADKSILQQRERIKQYAEELYFRQIQDEVVEADDCIAHYIQHEQENDELVIIYSNDHDFCQLIKENVHLYLHNKKSTITKPGFKLFFDYDLANATLMKAIEGCTSDMVHGVKGIKEKSLIKFFPELRTHKVNIEEILLRAAEINGSRTKAQGPYEALKNLLEGKTNVPIDNVSNGRELLNLNYKLVNLHEPFITEECKETIHDETQLPMSPEDRGGKNLLRLMYEDGFINFIPNGIDGYRDFLVEFLPVVKREKKFFEDYYK